MIPHLSSPQNFWHISLLNHKIKIKMKKFHINKQKFEKFGDPGEVPNIFPNGIFRPPPTALARALMLPNPQA